jgi:hypothetical protein
MTLAGLEPAIFGSKTERPVHQATGPPSASHEAL